MTDGPDALYLSPHLDDAALSCGGQIAARVRAGQRVRVITVFAGDEPAEPPSGLVRRLHADFGLSSGVVSARRAEDAAAMRHLGCDDERWDETEGIYRLHPETGTALYPTLDALFGPVAATDEAVVAHLRQRLAALPRPRLVVVPLGVGGQVDHAVVRAAAEACFDNATLRYYEDYPYVERPMALWRVLRWRRGWTGRVEPFETADLEAKLAAIARYESQVKPLFGDVARMRQRVTVHQRRRGGERLWERCP